MNATAHNCKPKSNWARKSYQVEKIAETIIGCNCDDTGVCKHIEHVIKISSKDCLEYNPISDQDRIQELKEFSSERRKKLLEKVREEAKAQKHS